MVSPSRIYPLVANVTRTLANGLEILPMSEPLKVERRVLGHGLPGTSRRSDPYPDPLTRTVSRSIAWYWRWLTDEA